MPRAGSGACTRAAILPATLRRWDLRTPCGVLIVLLGAVSWTAAAQVTPHGPEFQVNTVTTQAQFLPAIAVDPRGGFVVTWGSMSSDGTDNSGYSIQAQRYDTAGDSLGPEFQVNSYTTEDQVFQSIAMDEQGNFVVVWESWGSAGSDTSLKSIQGQRFDAGGAPLGSQFQVNTYTTNAQAYPSVASDSQGNFVVAWSSIGSAGTDIESWSVQARRFAADGTPLTDDFQVNTYTPSDQFAPKVVVDAQGRSTIVWTNWLPGGGAAHGYSVHARRYDASGIPIGDEFQVNTLTNSYQVQPAVAVDPQGDFIVAWASLGSGGSDSDSMSVQARRYDSDGSPLAAEFQVNTYTTGYQGMPSVAMDGQSRFIVVWHSNGSGGNDSSFFSAHGQRYDASGAPLGAEFQVNTYTTDAQGDPSVGTDPDGNFLVAWESMGSSGTDSDGLSIQAQRYDELFRDGFDTGDSSRWSVTVP